MAKKTAKALVTPPDAFVIDDETEPKLRDRLYNPLVGFEVKGHGLVPRDFAAYPKEMFGAPPAELTLIPRSEWDARIKELEETQSSLWHVRERMGPNGGRAASLDQNGQGYCWAYSNGSAIQLVLGAAGESYKRISAHAVAWKVKGGRDEGGWCGLSAKFAREVGYPDVSAWPEKSMSRQYDRPETWANAAARRITEDYVDLTRSVYDQNLTFDQVATCLLLGIPCAVDFNWWSHSVCAVRLVRVEAGSYGLEIWNSWSDGWGTNGMGILRGSRAIPDGAVATRVVGRAA